MLRFRGDWFTTGRSRFVDHIISEMPEPTAKVYVQVRIADLKTPLYAQLDTGAAWSILSPELAQEAGIRTDGGKPTTLSTRFGLKRGHIVRAPFALVAQEGETLQMEGSFFICPDWPFRQVFLGYSGLLDSIRFALDPQVNDFYFGPC
jgi:hypothetical protein